MPLSLAAQFALPFAPGLLNALFGMFKDPDNRREKAQQLLDPQRIINQGNIFTQGIRQNPAFSQAQSNVASSQNALINNLSANFGKAGIKGGVADTSMALAKSGAGFKLAGLEGLAGTAGLRAAQENAAQQAQAALSGAAPRNLTQELFGEGFKSIIPLILAQASGGTGGPGGVDTNSAEFQDWLKKWMEGGAW